jgi:hypothetical protein
MLAAVILGMGYWVRDIGYRILGRDTGYGIWEYRHVGLLYMLFCGEPQEESIMMNC